jgi:hypothetical protein
MGLTSKSVQMKEKKSTIQGYLLKNSKNVTMCGG